MILLDGETLSPLEVAAIAAGSPVGLAPAARERMAASASRVADRPDVLRAKWSWLVGAPPPDDPGELVRRFVLGHCAAVGEPLSPAIVRATMAVRANVLATGATGCRPACADRLITMLERDIVPIIPSQGSTGAAGSPILAHLLRAACGWGGDVWVRGVRTPSAEAVADLGPFEPNPKEALSLINGDTLTTATAALLCVRADRLMETAISACALSFEVVRADPSCLSAEAADARRNPHVSEAAARIRAKLEGSELCVSGTGPDPFSVRCAPAVLGAALSTLDHVRGVVAGELNAAADNPLILDGEAPVEAGNFHGAPVALAMDHLKTALVLVASISERRIFRLTYGQLSGLPSFLVPGTGLNSGLMLAQYTAASLVSECKGLAHPASVDTIPTVQHREDHVPMGPVAARGAIRIAEAVADVLAIELMCAAQGLEFCDPDARLGEGSAATRAAVRALVPVWTDDRVLHPDLAALGGAVRAGRFTQDPGLW